MTDEQQSEGLVRGFAWYHWGLVVFAAFDGLLAGGIYQAAGAAVGMLILVVVARVVWGEVRRHRRAAEDAQG